MAWFPARPATETQSDMQPDAYNIGVNNWATAGQTISHLHVHLTPRYAGDDANPCGGVCRIFPKKAKYWT